MTTASSKTKKSGGAGAKGVPKRPTGLSTKLADWVVPLVVECVDIEATEGPTAAEKFKEDKLKDLLSLDIGDPGHDVHGGYFAKICAAVAADCADCSDAEQEKARRRELKKTVAQFWRNHVKNAFRPNGLVATFRKNAKGDAAEDAAPTTERARTAAQLWSKEDDNKQTIDELTTKVLETEYDEEDDRVRHRLKERSKVVNELFSKLAPDVQEDYKTRASKEKADHAAYERSRAAREERKEEFVANVGKSLQTLCEGRLGIATATVFLTFFDEEGSTFSHSFMRADSTVLKNKQWQQLNTFNTAKNMHTQWSEKYLGEVSRGMGISAVCADDTAGGAESEDDLGASESDSIVELVPQDGPTAHEAVAGGPAVLGVGESTGGGSAPRSGTPAGEDDGGESIKPVEDDPDTDEEDLGPRRPAAKGRVQQIDDDDERPEAEEMIVIDKSKVGQGPGPGLTDNSGKEGEQGEGGVETPSTEDASKGGHTAVFADAPVLPDTSNGAGPVPPSPDARGNTDTSNDAAPGVQSGGSSKSKQTKAKKATNLATNKDGNEIPAIGRETRARKRKAAEVEEAEKRATKRGRGNKTGTETPAAVRRGTRERRTTVR